MRKRLMILLAALPMTLLLAFPSAHADFHGACIGAFTAVGGADLKVDANGDFLFSGVVNCPGADITINSVTLQTFPESQNPLGTASGSCNDAVAPCVVSGTAPVSSIRPPVWALDTNFKVTVQFTATGNVFGGVLGGPTSYSTSRVVGFNYNGVGQPYSTSLPIY